ncbi:MAG TPA: hypothetical protein VGF29_05025 [Hyphomicrobiaceae bacterium]|jgi:hypothetical protein
MSTERQPDTGKGALFRNDKKERDAHPDYTGSAEVNGRKFWLSAWIRTSEKTGKKYMSLAFRPAAPQADDQAKRDWQAPAEPEIPF